MTNLKSINPRDLAPDGLPLFLGDPTAKPNQVLPEYPWNFYLAAIGLIAEKYDHLFPDPANYQLREFIECANIDGPELFEESFIRWYKIREYWGPGPKEAFAALINQLRDPKKSSLYKIHPRLIDRELSPEKPNHQVDTGREISPKPIPQHGPKTATQVSKSKKPYLRLAQDCRQWILENQPWPQCIKVFDTVLRYTFNKGSSKGRKIYRYGQAHIIRLILKKPHLTVREALDKGRQIRRCWQWLKRTGFLNKAWNENPELHHNAGWFVCTSMKQRTYFRDPEKRHRPS